MPEVGPQNVAAATKRAKITNGIVSEFTGMNMVNVRLT